MKAKAIEVPQAPEHFAAIAAVHPDWHEAIQRLANAIAGVSCQLDQLREAQDSTTFVKRCSSLVTTLIDVLDAISPEPELEPSLGLGWKAPSGVDFGGTSDREQEDEHDEDGGDHEPSLGSHETGKGVSWSICIVPSVGIARCTLTAKSSATMRGSNTSDPDPTGAGLPPSQHLPCDWVSGLQETATTSARQHELAGLLYETS